MESFSDSYLDNTIKVFRQEAAMQTHKPMMNESDEQKEINNHYVQTLCGVIGALLKVKKLREPKPPKEDKKIKK
jgi:hypothetical protein